MHSFRFHFGRQNLLGNHCLGKKDQIVKRYVRVERPNDGVEKKWFKENQILIEKLKNGLHFVFLEGFAGTGKGEILGRLERIGYTTVKNPFLPIALEYGVYNRTVGYLGTQRWLNSMQQSLEKIAKDYKSGTISVKNDIVFVGRSFLTPHIYSNFKNFTFLPELMQEVRSKYNCSIVLCKTDPEIIKQRVAIRLAFLTPEERELRDKLGEQDNSYLTEIASIYQSLERSSTVDATLDTTSTKQSAAALLRMYGLGFNFVPEIQSK